MLVGRVFSPQLTGSTTISDGPIARIKQPVWISAINAWNHNQSAEITGRTNAVWACVQSTADRFYPRGGGGGGGGTLLFSYIRRLESCFGVQNFWISIFLGGFRKKRIFWGYEDFVDIFWGHHKIGLYFGVISMHFRVFLWSRYRIGGILGVAEISNVFRVLEIPGIFWGNDRCWARVYGWRKKWKYLPWGSTTICDGHSTRIVRPEFFFTAIFRKV